MFTKKEVTLQDTLAKSRGFKQIFTDVKQGLQEVNDTLKVQREARNEAIRQAEADIALIESEAGYNESVVKNIDKILGN